LIPGKPDIIHCHNLHGGYFDLSYLPDLASAIPTVITLHDAWLLSGHCAHSFSCQRWRAGCGDCPDLTIPPAITVDRTAENWMRKAAIYKRCQLYITTPSKWLMNKVHESMLACAVIDSAVIPNGVDLSVFTDVQRRDEARRRLGIDQGDFVLVFAANGVRANAWKDIDTLRNALKIVAARLQNQRSVRMLAIGEDAPNEFIGDAILEFIPYVEDANILAQYFRASDVYVHAARADTFPTTILEALACGTPVIATAVGGIPEQVRSLDLTCTATGADTHDVDRATGILTDAGNPMAMAAAIEYLANNPPVTSRLAENARLDAVERFDINNHVETYLQWYRHILDNKKPQHGVVA
jgi:glycosyltransferase involved in cell wall biosynthesis